MHALYVWVIRVAVSFSKVDRAETQLHVREDGQYDARPPSEGNLRKTGGVVYYNTILHPTSTHP
jgi:hypothetical protein